MKNIVIFRCVHCNVKRVFEFDLSKLGTEEGNTELGKLGSEYQSVLMAHAKHIGYALTYNIETDSDFEPMAKEIKEMLG